jgi:hypothetical protein
MQHSMIATALFGQLQLAQHVSKSLHSLCQQHRRHDLHVAAYVKKLPEVGTERARTTKQSYRSFNAERNTVAIYSLPLLSKARAVPATRQTPVST